MYVCGVNANILFLFHILFYLYQNLIHNLINSLLYHNIYRRYIEYIILSSILLTINNTTLRQKK